MKWILNRIQYPVYNLGEGKRIGIWVQGCSLVCKGCISPSLQTTAGGKKIEIELLVNEITKTNQFYKGITITGGEPFQQYRELISFCAFLKQKAKLDIYVFSGYTLDELYIKFPDKLFLRYIDLLMDGRYEKNKHDNQNLKGSSNQNLYRIVENKPILQKSIFKSNKFSLNFDDDNQIFLSGIPKKNELFQLSKYLSKTGINLKFK